LHPNQFAYSEASYDENERHLENKQLIVSLRKQLIEITDCMPCSNNIEYYHAYSTLVKTNMPPVPILTVASEDDEDDSEDEIIPDTSNTPVEDIDIDLDAEDIDENIIAKGNINTDAPVKKRGGGRPKGSPNKPKKGKKKKAKAKIQEAKINTPE
jgi:hypothetical protein